MTHFARALGAARSGKPDDAKAEIAELREKLRAANDAWGRAGRHPVAGRECLGALMLRASTTKRSRP
jgi:hypothetical protein